VEGYIGGLEYELLNVVLRQMNMTLFHVPTPEDLEFNENSSDFGLKLWMLLKGFYIILGGFGNNAMSDSYLDSTNTYNAVSMRWYVPCSEKLPRWSSFFRILSVELWLVLTISTVIAAISITLVARYSCMSESQGYKTLKSSLTNVWAVILGVSVSTMPRAPSLRSLFLAWVCFSLAFNTVFQAFLTTYLIDSGYKTPIQNMEELLDSDNKIAYHERLSFIFVNGDETEVLKVQRNLVNCPSFEVCLYWTIYHKNVSVLLEENLVEMLYAVGDFIGENSEPLLCGLEDGVVLNSGLSMIMFYGDPLMKRVTEIIDRVVEAGIYNYWISIYLNNEKLRSRKIAIVNKFDEYYSFNLYHMQPAFYLLLMGWCISVICFMVELLYNRVLTKIK
jgi:hypothetical protein